MEPRLSVLTLAVDDLEVMRQFYSEVIGQPPVAENQDIAFFKMNGLILSLCKKKDLAHFIGIASEGSGFKGITLGHNVPTKEEVDVLYKQLKNKGVTVVKEPTETPFGAYFFYFSDPENNILEIAFNPFIPLDEAGNTTTHLPIDKL
jgi:catechol 2,3-dioxygenase-like lactoylglutathione lyase family enzyme